MKRKIDVVDEEEDSENEGSKNSADESEDEEPRIKDVLSNLSQSVSQELPCFIASLIPEILYSGLPVDSYFEIHA